MIDIGDNAVVNVSVMPHQPIVSTPKCCPTAGRFAGPPPESHLMLRHGLRHQAFERKGNHRHPGDLMFQAQGPKSRGRELGLQDYRATGPVGSKHGIALRLGMKQRHIHQRDIVTTQPHMDGRHFPCPQTIRMSPEHRLGREVVPRCKLNTEVSARQAFQSWQSSSINMSA